MDSLSKDVKLLWKDDQKFEKGSISSSDTVTLYHAVRLTYQVCQNIEWRSSNIKTSSLVVNPQKSPTMLILSLSSSVYSTEQMKECVFFGG